MMPRNADFQRQQQERRDARIMRVGVAIVGLVYLMIGLGVIWLVRHPHEVWAFFGQLAAGFGIGSR